MTTKNYKTLPIFRFETWTLRANCWSHYFSSGWSANHHFSHHWKMLEKKWPSKTNLAFLARISISFFRCPFSQTRMVRKLTKIGPSNCHSFQINTHFFSWGNWTITEVIELFLWGASVLHPHFSLLHSRGKKLWWWWCHLLLSCLIYFSFSSFPDHHWQTKLFRRLKKCIWNSSAFFGSHFCSLRQNDSNKGNMT